MKYSTIHYWLALLRAPGIGPAKTLFLLNNLSSPEGIFNASPKTLSALGIKNKKQDGILNPKWDLIEKDLAWLQQSDHYFISIQDKLYPPLLKEIADPPIGLFVEGNPEILSAPQIGIVGSRNPSNSGLDNSFYFAKFLAENSITITSGLASGIDTESHKGALAAAGNTIAVMGTGIDKIYPAANSALSKKIVAQGGALISEFPTNTPAKAENFPRRNRIISGLSRGILVIEATIRSGSLITARLANEQGREVFAIPGSIYNPLARGCHFLIRQGAKLVETAEDILEEFPTSFCGRSQSVGAIHELPKLEEQPQGNEQPQKNNENNLDSEQQKLLDYIKHEITPLDILVEKSGQNISEISSILLQLELLGHIKSANGGFVKT